jgi:hypothetical protein
MTSTLERLFVFAKATGAEQRENFTTEALGVAPLGRTAGPALTAARLPHPRA